MTPEEESAAKIQIIDEYNRTMSELATIKSRVMSRYMSLAEREIEEESGRIRSEFGRILALNPLPVREKQRLSKSTNWTRYRSWIDASGEVDVSSREAKRDQERAELAAVKNPPKPGPHVEEVTEKMRSWEHYEGVLNDHVITVSEQARWFQATPTPGGEFRLWTMNEGDEKPTLVFKFPAGDDEWSDPSLEYDRGESKWAEERDAVVEAFESSEEGSF